MCNALKLNAEVSRAKPDWVHVLRRVISDGCSIRESLVKTLAQLLIMYDVAGTLASILRKSNYIHISVKS